MYGNFEPDRNHNKQYKEVSSSFSKSINSLDVVNYMDNLFSSFYVPFYD